MARMLKLTKGANAHLGRIQALLTNAAQAAPRDHPLSRVDFAQRPGASGGKWRCLWQRTP